MGLYVKIKSPPTVAVGICDKCWNSLVRSLFGVFLTHCALIDVVAGFYSSNAQLEQAASILPNACSLASCDFYDLVTTDPAFVDKTAMIEEYLRNPARVIVITRPRRWGKTTNAVMLKRFLEIEVNRTGYRTESVNRKLFTGGRMNLSAVGSDTDISLKQLKICSSNYSMEHQGRYPVLFTSFSTVGAANYEGMKCFLKWKIDKLFADHYYLKLRSSSSYQSSATITDNDHTLTLSLDEEELLNIYLNRTYSDEQLTESLRFLSRLLYRYYGRKVHLVLDEFDTPAISLFSNVLRQYRRQYKKENRTDEVTENQLFDEAFQSTDVLRTVQLLNRLMLNTLRDNEALEKALVTGIARLKKADLLSGMKNDRGEFREYTLINDEFADHYGFSQEEVDQLIRQLADETVRNFSQHRKKIAATYAGYNINGRLLYNPWSVRNYLQHEGRLRYYWTNSAYTGLVDDALIVTPVVQQQLQTLAEGASVRVALKYPIELKNCTGDDLYNILLFVGHLTPKNSTNYSDGHSANHDAHPTTYELIIPNQEVRNVCLEKVLHIWY